jgi:hypothetical protein
MLGNWVQVIQGSTSPWGILAMLKSFVDHYLERLVKMFTMDVFSMFYNVWKVGMLLHICMNW